MSSNISDTNCPKCGSGGIYFTSDEEGAECEHTFCCSLTCGYYEMNNQNPNHPDFSKNGTGHHTSEEVKEIRRSYGYEDEDE